MGRTNPIDLGVISFEKQGDAIAHFRSMLRKYKPGDRVDDSDAIELAELLKRHPEYSLKLGAGIEHFGVEAAEYNTQCFNLVRTDGSRDRFSFQSCVSGRAR
ncbi:DCL family protein [Asticcacaulis sp. SL142]|uniref:DCL family protein n=1 Tax=Asticcacaulis sp. SL142 TaxID=2995155 RepID=UPI00226CA903|nr:DCL family protein [Asticcacaulis sp. SL142]WAC49804.1 DCL family protein [Asticcacaulis sp. SL142]